MSRDPFQRLGLRPDAGVRDVKRAYARLLREARPDEDPTGFQALSEAYEAALAIAKRREASMPAAVEAVAPEADAHLRDAPAPHEVPAEAPPLPPPPPPRRRPRPLAMRVDDEPPLDDAPRTFEYAPFHQALMATLGLDDPHALGLWLRRQRALWSVDLKRALTGVVIEALAREDALPSRAQYGVLLEFFGIDVVLHRQLPYGWALEAIDARMRGRDVIEWHDLRCRRIRARPGERLPPAAKPLEALAWAELRGPRQRWRRFRHCGLGAGPRRARELLMQIERDTGLRAEALLDPEAVAFYRDAGDQARITRARLSLVGMRLVTLVVAWLVFSALIASRALQEGGELGEVLRITTSIAALVLAIWWSWAGMILVMLRLQGWLASTRWLRLSHLFAGALLGTGVLLAFALPRASVAFAALASLAAHATRLGPLMLQVLPGAIGVALLADALPYPADTATPLHAVAALFALSAGIAIAADHRRARLFRRRVSEIDIARPDRWHVLASAIAGVGLLALGVIATALAG